MTQARPNGRRADGACTVPLFVVAPSISKLRAESLEKTRINSVEGESWHGKGSNRSRPGAVNAFPISLVSQS